MYGPITVCFTNSSVAASANCQSSDEDRRAPSGSVARDERSRHRFAVGQRRPPRPRARPASPSIQRQHPVARRTPPSPTIPSSTTAISSRISRTYVVGDARDSRPRRSRPSRRSRARPRPRRSGCAGSGRARIAAGVRREHRFEPETASRGRLPLDEALGEARDDPAVEQHHQDQARDDRDHARRRRAGSAAATG